MEKKPWETEEAATARLEQEDAERASIAQDAIARARRRVAEFNAEQDAKVAPDRNAALQRQADDVASATGKAQARAAQKTARANAAHRRAEREAARKRRRLWRMGR